MSIDYSNVEEQFEAILRNRIRQLHAKIEQITGTLGLFAQNYAELVCRKFEAEAILATFLKLKGKE